jgi:hypothetical protein
MKKVGIITICDYHNYGNRLQNYAVQEVLESLGCEVTTIKNKQRKETKQYHRQSITRIVRKITSIPLNQLFLRLARKAYNIFLKPYRKKLMAIKKQAFIKFTEKHIKESNFSISDEYIPNDLSDEFDYFVVGSDQVWNPYYRKGSSIDFLTFASEEKRIAYAASFGISLIPERFTKDYKNWLSKFAFISVREESGAAIVRKLIGKEVDVLIDPTLMLDHEKWLSISKPSRCLPNKPYLFTYFLSQSSQKARKTVKDIASIYDLVVLNLFDITNKKLFISDPSEFLYLIHNSSLIFTDSFHATIFSIIFEKPFVVFERTSKHPSMNSRITTLLKIFSLESRLWTENIIANEIMKIDYSKKDDVLAKEKMKTIRYLRKALDI